MTSDLSIFNMASAMAKHAVQRHRVISENIAQANMPDYRARDIAPFDAELVERLQSGVGTQADRDLRLQRMMQATEIEDAAVSPNGNSVNVEDQMARAVDAQAQHNAALAIYRKSLELLRLSFASQR